MLFHQVTEAWPFTVPMTAAATVDGQVDGPVPRRGTVALPYNAKPTLVSWL
jgi:hypothetical protein